MCGKPSGPGADSFFARHHPFPLVCDFEPPQGGNDLREREEATSSHASPYSINTHSFPLRNARRAEAATKSFAPFEEGRCRSKVNDIEEKKIGSKKKQTHVKENHMKQDKKAPDGHAQCGQRQLGNRNTAYQRAGDRDVLCQSHHGVGELRGHGVGGRSPSSPSHLHLNVVERGASVGGPRRCTSPTELVQNRTPISSERAAALPSQHFRRGP